MLKTKNPAFCSCYKKTTLKFATNDHAPFFFYTGQCKTVFKTRQVYKKIKILTWVSK